MDTKQVLAITIFGFLLVPAWTCEKQQCFSEQELSKVANKKLNKHYPHRLEQLPAAAAAEDDDSPAPCPVELFQRPPTDAISNRSLSPWRYVIKTLEDHFPSTYAEAECLCSGCILIQDMNPVVESHDYNSVPFKQSKVFLKKELCESNHTLYRLRPVSVEVAVGCTCARAKVSG